MAWELKGQLAGAAGPQGSTWHVGPRPTGALSVGESPGDFFLVTDGEGAGEIYIATESGWPAAPTAVAGGGGGPGSTTAGETDPTDTVGVDGSYYINYATGTVFGPKTNGSWGAGRALQGTIWHNGTSDPAAGTDVTEARVGDFYLNTVSGDIFKCTDATSGAQVWSSLGSIKGPAGVGVAAGVIDAANPVPLSPSPGDLFIAGATPPASGWPNGLTPSAGDALVFSNGQWYDIGPATQGPPGTPGSRWFITNGSEADVTGGTAVLDPSSPSPLVGDYLMILDSSNAADNGKIYRYE